MLSAESHLLKGPSRPAQVPRCVFRWGPGCLRTPRLSHSGPGSQGCGTGTPHLGKKTTCLLGFIWFQGEATGFTLKITKHANSFNRQMFFVSVGQII